MKKINLLLVIYILFCGSLLFSQPMSYYGTPQGIYNSMLQNKVQSSLMAIREVNTALSIEEEKLRQARENFWNSYPDGGNMETYREEYLQLLAEKDLYFLYAGFMSYVNQAMEVLDAPAIIQQLRGKKYDRGFDKVAEIKFQAWSNSFNWYWGKNSKGSVSNEFLQENLRVNTDKYLEFVKVRDKAEYLYRNPRSPLKSKDPVVYYKGLLLASGVCEDLTGCEEYYRDVNTVFTEAEIRAAVGAYMKTNPEHRTTYFAGNGYGAAPVKEIDWLISKHDPEKYALYLIRRRTNLPWAWTKIIHENRIKRYGADRMSGALQNAWKNAEDIASECVGDPLEMHFLRFGTKGRPKNYSILSGADCVAQEIGINVLWTDLMDFPLSSADLDLAKQELLNELASFQPVTPALRIPVQDRYSKLIEGIDETLLLRAYFFQKFYGQHLKLGDSGDRILEVFENERTKELHIGLEGLLTGFAVQKKDPGALAIIMLSNKYRGEIKSLERFELGVSDFNELEVQYGEGSVSSYLDSLNLWHPEKSQYFEPFYVGMRRGPWIGNGKIIRNHFLQSEPAFKAAEQELEEKYRKLLSKYTAYKNSDDLLYSSEDLDLVIKEYQKDREQLKLDIILKAEPEEELMDEQELKVMCEELLKPILERNSIRVRSIFWNILLKDYHIYTGKSNNIGLTPMYSQSVPKKGIYDTPSWNKFVAEQREELEQSLELTQTPVANRKIIMNEYLPKEAPVMKGSLSVNKSGEIIISIRDPEVRSLSAFKKKYGYE